MSSENNFSEDLLKKIKDGDTSLLFIGALVMFIPLLTLFFLTGHNAKEDKKLRQEKARNMGQRKSVFNFGTNMATNRAKNSGKSNKGWFSTPRTPEQIVRDELDSVRRKLEKDVKPKVPYGVDPTFKLMYEAENNYYYCYANGLLQQGLLDQAEEKLLAALDSDKDNPYLAAYVFSALTDIYQKKGDMKKMEEAAKKYIEAADKLPNNAFNIKLKENVRNAYQALKTIGEYTDSGFLYNAVSKDPVSRSVKMPSIDDIKSLYKNFPVKYE